MEHKFNLILSGSMVSILNRINDDISKKLLFLNNNLDYGFDMSYIDITDKDNIISFISSNKILKILESYPNPQEKIWSTNRNTQKIGRFISGLLGYSDVKIEQFVNAFKSEIKRYNNLDNFNIVKGEKISFYYNGKHYSSGGGSLNKSCMRHDHCKDYFDFYTSNTDVVSMVILYSNKKENIISGRALLWNLSDNKKLLDRIYTSVDSDKNLFINLAKKNGWLYKKTQSYDEKIIMTPDGEETNLIDRIFINKKKYDYFPYLDTFYFFDRKNFYITNDINEYKNNKNIIMLRSIHGKEMGNRNFVFDDYNKDLVKVDNTVFCKVGDTRTLKNDAITIDSNKFATPDNVRFSRYDNKIYGTDESKWSYYHNTFINKNSCFIVYLDEKMNKYDYYHSDLRGEKFEYVKNKDSYFIKDILIKGIDNNYYLPIEYDESKIKTKKDETEELNIFFDEFIKKLSLKKVVNTEYGTFYSTGLSK